MSFAYYRMRFINKVVLPAFDAVYEQRLKRYPELRDLLAEMNGARSTGVGVSDSIALYETVLERKPRFILELGAGQSSAVIALAARVAGIAPRFVAVEESQDWLDHHREVIPRNLQADVNLVQLETDARDCDGQRAAFYKSIPRHPYEMIHIDGPDHDKLGAQVSCDAIDLLPFLGQSCSITFDGRENSARLARPHLEAGGFATSRHTFTKSYTFSR